MAALLLWGALGVAPARAQFDRVKQGVVFSARVTDAQSGEQLNQVKLELVRFPDELAGTVFTDSSGRGSFQTVSPGAYYIRASLAGYWPAEIRVEPLRSQATYDAQMQLSRLELKSQPPGGTLSARQLSIPETARKEFNQGVEFLNIKKDARQSIEHFENAVSAYANYYEAYFLLGMAHLATNSPDPAQTALRKAIELNAKFVDPYFPLAEVLVSQKKFDDAGRFLQAAMALDPDGWRWPFELAICYAKEGDWNKALNYGQMAKSRPNPPSKVHLLMADLYSNTGNPAGAVAELEEFEKLDPQSPYMARVREVLPQLRQRAANSSATHPRP